jgi:hypothetical protein
MGMATLLQCGTWNYESCESRGIDSRQPRELEPRERGSGVHRTPVFDDGTKCTLHVNILGQFGQSETPRG